MSETTAVARPEKAPLAMGSRGVQLASMEDAFRFAKVVISSGLAPKGIDTPEKAMIAMQYGAELGFSPMRSLSVITVVNGRTGIYGEAALAKIHETNVCSLPPVMRHEGEGDNRRAIVRFQRHSMPEPVEVAFTVADAKKAKLWQKGGPWSDYPDVMLGWRAVGRAGKLYFGDVLLGLPIAEELRDYPPAETRPVTPPAEPDPLLAIATPEPESDDEPEPEPAEIISERRVTAPKIDDDEAAIIRAVERLENRMVGAETRIELDAAWDAAESLVNELTEKERARLKKSYGQLSKGLKG